MIRANLKPENAGTVSIAALSQSGLFIPCAKLQNKNAHLQLCRPTDLQGSFHKLGIRAIGPQVMKTVTTLVHQHPTVSPLK